MTAAPSSIEQARAARRAAAPDILAGNDISFTVNDSGTHILLSCGGKRIDFWPGSGRWVVDGGPCGDGVYTLVGYIKAGFAKRRA